MAAKVSKEYLSCPEGRTVRQFKMKIILESISYKKLGKTSSELTQFLRKKQNINNKKTKKSNKLLNNNF
jgi:hypothetical protein